MSRTAGIRVFFLFFFLSLFFFVFFYFYVWSTSILMSKCASRLLSPISFPVYQICISSLISVFASSPVNPSHKHSVVARVEPVVYPVSHFGTVEFVSSTRVILHTPVHIYSVHIDISSPPNLYFLNKKVNLSLSTP